MVLENKLNITNQIELNKLEEEISKKKAKKLFDSGKINTLKVGTLAGLKQIHKFLFGDIYDFADKLRTVNISKGIGLRGAMTYRHFQEKLIFKKTLTF